MDEREAHDVGNALVDVTRGWSYLSGLRSSPPTHSHLLIGGRCSNQSGTVCCTESGFVIVFVEAGEVRCVLSACRGGQVGHDERRAMTEMTLSSCVVGRAMRRMEEEQSGGRKLLSSGQATLTINQVGTKWCGQVKHPLDCLRSNHTADGYTSLWFILPRTVVLISNRLSYRETSL